MEGSVVQIPEEIAHIFGTPDAGTRIYRADGTEEENSVWFDAVCEVAGSTVSPGGACMYAPVSRAAVHQRMKEGKLTAFLFHVRRKSKTWLGRPREARESPFIYIPVVEIKAWAEEIKERAIKQGKVTREELEGAKPDWEGEFLEWKNTMERPGLREFMEDTGLTLTDIIKARFGVMPKDYINPDYARYLEAVKREPALGEIRFGKWLEGEKARQNERKERKK